MKSSASLYFPQCLTNYLDCSTCFKNVLGWEDENPSDSDPNTTIMMIGGKCRKKNNGLEVNRLVSNQTCLFHQLCDFRSLTLTCDSSPVKMGSQHLPHRIMKMNESFHRKTFLLCKTNINTRYYCCYMYSTPVFRLYRILEFKHSESVHSTPLSQSIPHARHMLGVERITYFESKW